MGITQKQLAEHLGMSRSSVTDALNGHPRVAETTRERVRAAASEYGYTEHTNHASKVMIARRHGRRVKTGIITVLSRLEGGAMRAAPFFASILDGIELEAGSLGVDVLLCFQRDENTLPRAIREDMVDGIILGAYTFIRRVNVGEWPVPVVSLVARTDGAHNLLVDDCEGAMQAVRHLAERGHRRIGYLGIALVSREAANRLAGFKAGMNAAGLPLDNDLIETSLINLSQGAEGVDMLWQRNKEITALVCYNDFIAMQAVTRLQEKGLGVPEDVSVVGFDDISVESNFTPTLTSVAFDRPAMGRRAAQVLCEWADILASDSTAFRRETLREEIFPVTLVERDSTRAIG